MTLADLGEVDHPSGAERRLALVDVALGENALAHVLNAAEHAGPDGTTFTTWRDGAAMRDAVYQPGDHRDQLDRYKREQTADRTSFTRLRARTTRGTWNGVDPIDVAAA
jgi:hypothetical protein